MQLIEKAVFMDSSPEDGQFARAKMSQQRERLT
jgi:hypothetical protein